MHDNIFAVPRAKLGDFTFDDTVANVFPDMINRSVPGYSNIVQAIGMLTEKYAQKNTNLYDLGCSLGACTLEMSAHAPEGAKVIGIDNSEAMIKRAKNIVAAYKHKTEAIILLDDITTYPLENASIIVLNFVLQFINKEYRNDIIKKIYNALTPGGILVLSEKFIFDDQVIQNTLYDLHLDFKKANGYSDLEISQKRTSLENVLIADSIPEHMNRLKQIGFKHCNVWFQCFNFGSIIAIK
ncbi:MAG: carboxy-S-adenosyl-L-methionine synthase CmoA [Succinivibrionaceae bacterium]